MSHLWTASRSVFYWWRLGQSHSLHLQHQRLNRIYSIHGRDYRLFRETVCTSGQGVPNVLVIGFQLRLLGRSRVLHRLFQRACKATTPFWSGLPGFRVKLWLVAPTRNEYLGIYDWRGTHDAAAYVAYLLPILRFWSVPGSVWYEHHVDTELEAFLAVPERGNAD